MTDVFANIKLHRVRIIFSEVIQEDLGRGSNSWRVWESAVSPPLGVWGQNTIQIQENSVQFNTFWSKI